MRVRLISSRALCSLEIILVSAKQENHAKSHEPDYHLLDDSFLYQADSELQTLCKQHL